MRSMERTTPLSPYLAVQDAPEQPAAFDSGDDLLDAARQLLAARRVQARAVADGEHADKLDSARARERAWTAYWHDSLDLTGERLPLTQRCARQGLTRVEREIVVGLVLDRLALLPGRASTCGDVIALLALPPRLSLDAIRSLSESGTLCRSGIIAYDDPDDDIRDRRVELDPLIVQSALRKKGAASAAGWPVDTPDDLYDHLRVLSHALRRKSDEFDSSGMAFRRSGPLYRAARTADRLFGQLKETLAAHPGWRLNGFLNPSVGFEARAQMILLALVGNELGHVPHDDSMFTGAGLARIASRTPCDAPLKLDLLQPGSDLLERDLVQPSEGTGERLSGGADDLADTLFELSENGLRLLGIERRTQIRANGTDLREPQLSLDQLVLSDELRRQLALVLAQARNTELLMGRWGIGSLLPYGRGLTLLFYGPPGVGKTACAEALAAELGRPILVADYSRVQNCFVGQTEKNIVRTFRRARAGKAVLFWDEADAMFYDREQGVRSWEVRDVNVLLQQIERFDGVCILATNRELALDKALERRISLKMRFERPDRRMRGELWARLVPPQMPTATDVEFERLADEDLSGGEIKNVVLNAARLALSRGPDAQVSMADFEEAIRMETEGKWSGGSCHQTGFRSTRESTR